MTKNHIDELNDIQSKFNFLKKNQIDNKSIKKLSRKIKQLSDDVHGKTKSKADNPGLKKYRDFIDKILNLIKKKTGLMMGSVSMIHKYVKVYKEEAKTSGITDIEKINDYIIEKVNNDISKNKITEILEKFGPLKKENMVEKKKSKSKNSDKKNSSKKNSKKIVKKISKKKTKI